MLADDGHLHDTGHHHADAEHTTTNIMITNIMTMST